MKFLLSILFLFSTLCSFAESYSASYFIKGIITDKDNKPVANTKLTLIGGNPTRVFTTNSTGEYFVEVIYYLPCLSGKTDQSDPNGLKIIREANGEVLTITCSKGSTKIKFSWEKHYINDEFHNPFQSSNAKSVVDLINIKLDRPAIADDSISKLFLRDEWLAVSTVKLNALNAIPIDTFVKAAKIKRDQNNRCYVLPDSSIIQFPDVYTIEKTPLWECFLGQRSMAGYLNLSFEKNEVRNIHINSLVQDILGGFQKLFVLKKEKDNTYVLTKTGFGKQYGYHTFHTNRAGYIIDMIETFGEY